MSPESPIEGVESLRQQATEAYKQFVAEGVKNIDDLDLEDPRAIEAQRIFDLWRNRLDAEAEVSREAREEANFAKTIFYYETGFTDPDYLEEILSFLETDLADVDDESEEPLPQLAERIREKMKEIEAALEAQNQ